MPSQPPLQRYMFAWLQRYGRTGILEVTMAMILLVSWSWIGFNSITSRFISQPIPAAIYVVQVWSSLYVFTVFFSKVYRKIWIILTCCEILVCLIFQTNLVDWLKGDCYGICLNLLTSFWYEFIRLSSCKSLIGAGRCPSCRCRMWDAKSRVVGVFHDVCGQIPSRLVTSCHHVSWIL